MESSPRSRTRSIVSSFVASCGTMMEGASMRTETSIVLWSLTARSSCARDVATAFHSFSVVLLRSVFTDNLRRGAKNAPSLSISSFVTTTFVELMLTRATVSACPLSGAISKPTSRNLLPWAAAGVEIMRLKRDPGVTASSTWNAFICSPRQMFFGRMTTSAVVSLITTLMRGRSASPCAAPPACGVPTREKDTRPSWRYACIFTYSGGGSTSAIASS